MAFHNTDFAGRFIKRFCSPGFGNAREAAASRAGASQRSSQRDASTGRSLAARKADGLGYSLDVRLVYLAVYCSHGDWVGVYYPSRFVGVSPENSRPVAAHTAH